MNFNKEEKDLIERCKKQAKENNDLAKEILAQEKYINKAPYSPFEKRFDSWLMENLIKEFGYKA
ncbi:MAG: hypothetical protein ABIB43_03160 [archaeon]